MALKERTQKIIEQYNLNDKVENLTKDLLSIPYAVDVEYDLDGFIDNIGDFILLVKYDIPVSLDNYFKVRQNFLYDVVETAKKHGLRRSGDSIEDYGQHFYFVFLHDKTWKRNWNIDDIQSITEKEAQEMALEEMEIKGHKIYFVDFGGYFGYSKLVFCNGHHIYYANDYELHHRGNQWCKGKTREELKEWYINGANSTLFAEEEISEPFTGYDEYNRKRHFLNNYYGMRTEYVSIFGIVTDETQAEFDKKTKTMTYNPVAFAYMPDAEFVKHHIELYKTLEKVKDDASNNYEYLKSAYLYEMHNHEYGINWQADYDTLSCFGNIEYHGCDLEAYFKELNFTDLQKTAYLDARKQYFKETENY